MYATTASTANVTYPGQAIGHGELNGAYSSDVFVGVLRIYDGAKVSATTDANYTGPLSILPKDESINAIGDDVYGCYKKVKIEPCDHSGQTSGATCPYCGQIVP